MNPSLRRAQCAGCSIPFFVCPHCDRGQRYCSPACSQSARHAAQRAAGHRYQRSRKGRCKHAQRQRHYRAKKRKQNIVTHQAPQPPIVSDVLVGVATDVFKPSLPIAETPHCHFCGGASTNWIRLGFLRIGRALNSSIQPPKRRSPWRSPLS